MLKKLKALWTGESSGMTAAAILIGVASLASRAFGVLRDHVLASTFGAGTALDAYFAAFRLPDTLYNLLILGALSAGFIPVFAEYLETKGKDAAWKLAAEVVSAVGFALAIGCIILAIFAPQIVPLITPGFEGDKLALTVMLTRIMLFSPFIMGLSGVMGGVLQATKRFFAFSLAPVLYNLGIIFGALVLSKPFGVAGVAWGVILGAALHFGVQAAVVWPMGLGKLPKPSFKPEGVRRITKLMAPRMLGLAVSQLNLVILMGFASYLSSGSVSIMELSDNLQSFAVGIIAVSYAVATFPMLAAAASKKDNVAFLRDLQSSMRKVLFWIVPTMIIFVLLRAQIVRLALGSGQFDWDDTIRTANVLGILSLSLPAQGIVALWARAFYAKHNSRVPLAAGVAAEAVNLLVAWTSYRMFGVNGLAWAFTASSWTNALWLYLVWWKRNPDIRVKLTKSTFKVLLASLVMLAAAYPMRQLVGTWYPLRTTLQVAAQSIAACLVGGLVFLLAAWILRIPELKEFWDVLRRKTLRVTETVAGAEEAQGGMQL